MSMDMEEQYDKIYRYCYFRLLELVSLQDVGRKKIKKPFPILSTLPTKSS